MDWSWLWWGILIWLGSVVWRQRATIRDEWAKTQAKRPARSGGKELERLRDEIEAMRKDRGLPPRPPKLEAGSMPPELGWDEMRRGMQRVAYVMVGPGASDVQKMQFKADMTEFASADPLVREIVQKVQALVAENPGQLQSKIYSRLPGYEVEQVRYALYFAHELGLIFRKKKGNSYQLYPPGETIEG